MSGDFLGALSAIAKEKDLTAEALLETFEAALVTAYKKDFPGMGELTAKLNPQKATFRIYSRRTVIAEGEPEAEQILLEEASRLQPGIRVGDTLEIDITPANMGRIDAQTTKQVLVQKIRETERDRVYEEYSKRVEEVLTGSVQRRDGRNVIINLGKVEAVLQQQEQVPTEPYRFNDRLKLYVLEVRKTPKGPQIFVSRTHPSLIRRLFELEVPEIADGVVLIKSVAREPGARSKIAVFSRDEKVDPVGSCVGHRGSRVQAVVNELYDEKIDIVRWSPDTSQFISEALSPAKAVSVNLNEDAKSAFVVVPDNQLSLAIGKSGQNVRLAARLTGWRIDIRSESQVSKQALSGSEDKSKRSSKVEEPSAHADAVASSTGVEGSESDDNLPIIELPDFDLDSYSEDVK